VTQNHHTSPREPKATSWKVEIIKPFWRLLFWISFWWFLIWLVLLLMISSLEDLYFSFTLMAVEDKFGVMYAMWLWYSGQHLEQLWFSHRVIPSVILLRQSKLYNRVHGASSKMSQNFWRKNYCCAARPLQITHITNRPHTPYCITSNFAKISGCPIRDIICQRNIQDIVCRVVFWPVEMIIFICFCFLCHLTVW